MRVESSSIPFSKAFELDPSLKGTFVKEIYLNENKSTIIKAYAREHKNEIMTANNYLVNSPVSNHVPETQYVEGEDRLYIVMPFIRRDSNTVEPLSSNQIRSLLSLCDFSIEMATTARLAPDILNIDDLNNSISFENIAFDNYKAWLVDTWPLKDLSWGYTARQYEKDVQKALNDIKT